MEIDMELFYWDTYDCDYKKAWHNHVRNRLRQFAKINLKLNKNDFEVRSNKAGPACSGEVTLHTNSLYLQVSTSSMGPSSSILIRKCNGMKDYTGDRNHFADIKLIDRPELLETKIHNMGLI